VTEVLQQIENLNIRMNEEFGGLGAVAARVEDLEQSLSGVWPNFDAVKEGQQRLETGVDRYHQQSVERDDLMADRIEEVRQQAEAQLNNLDLATTQRFERLTARTEQLDEVDRDLAYRLTLIEMQIEELNRIDQRLRREMWYLNEQRARLRVEQAQQELEQVTDARRQAEQRNAERSNGASQE
jgi:hypothetical protein